MVSPHSAAGYSGPWIEDSWVQRFCCDANESTQARFGGALVPIFVQWVDLFVKSGYRTPPELWDTLSRVLRPDVLYVTVSQNDQGIYEQVRGARDAVEQGRGAGEGEAGGKLAWPAVR